MRRLRPRRRTRKRALRRSRGEEANFYLPRHSLHITGVSAVSHFRGGESFRYFFERTLYHIAASYGVRDLRAREK